MTAVHCTLFTAPFAHPLEIDDGAGQHTQDELIASYHQAFLKECNFLWSGRSYIVKKTAPTYRGAVAADGVTLANPGIVAPIGNQAGNTAADNALLLNPTRFNILWGAKRFPNAPASDGELQHYQAEALGLSSYREGAGQAESADTTRKVFSVSLESISGTGLDGMGSSSRSGEGITCVFSGAGTEDGTIIASKCFMLLEFTQKIELRTGSVRSMD